MSRKTRAKTIPGQWVAFSVEMFQSPAWRVLSLSARRVIDRICIEFMAHGGKDNGKLPVRYVDFVEYGIDRDAIAPAIREACALGFLEVTEQGRAGNAEFRRPNLFRLTFPYTDPKCPATNEWKKFSDVMTATYVARMARAAGAETKGNGKHKASKNKTPVGETPTEVDRGNPDRKNIFPVGETPTTGHSRKTPTTIYISTPTTSLIGSS